MGAWGPGLYSSDVALDVRAMVPAVCRLPLEGEEIVELLCAQNTAANDPADEDHTTFWLVVADQLYRRGIVTGARDRALAIIDQGTDLDAMASLGMTPADLRKRGRALDELAARLREPAPDKRRAVLAKPQPLLVQPGEVYAYRIDSQGNCRNPYLSDAEARFTPVGWRACLVLASGHALGYLAWYQVAASPEPTAERPDLASALAAIDPAINGTGTLTRNHLGRIGLELLGTVDRPAVDPPAERRALSTVVNDRTVASVLSSWRPPGTYTFA